MLQSYKIIHLFNMLVYIELMAHLPTWTVVLVLVPMYNLVQYSDQWGYTGITIYVDMARWSRMTTRPEDFPQIHVQSM